MNVNLQDKIIFITGGTSALGRAFVRLALASGAKVWFTFFRNKAEAELLEKEGARGFLLDLSQADGLEQVKEEIKKAHGKLDILINNAGTSADGKIGNLTSADWHKVMEINLSSIFRITRVMLPLLYRSEQGRVLNVASRMAFHGGIGASNYAASKAGLIAFTKSLAMEVGRKGILVNALNPGFMISGMTKNLPQEIKDRHTRESVLGKHSDPDEVARFMVYLLSDSCRSVSGQVFDYDSRVP